MSHLGQKGGRSATVSRAHQVSHGEQYFIVDLKISWPSSLMMHARQKSCIPLHRPRRASSQAPLSAQLQVEEISRVKENVMNWNIMYTTVP